MQYKESGAVLGVSVWTPLQHRDTMTLLFKVPWSLKQWHHYLGVLWTRGWLWTPHPPAKCWDYIHTGTITPSRKAGFFSFTSESIRSSDWKSACDLGIVEGRETLLHQNEFLLGVPLYQEDIVTRSALHWLPSSWWEDEDSQNYHRRECKS